MNKSQIVSAHYSTCLVTKLKGDHTAEFQDLAPLSGIAKEMAAFPLHVIVVFAIMDVVPPHCTA